MRLTCGVDQPVEMWVKSEAKSESVFKTRHFEIKHKITRTSDIGLHHPSHHLKLLNNGNPPPRPKRL